MTLSIGRPRSSSAEPGRPAHTAMTTGTQSSTIAGIMCESWRTVAGGLSITPTRRARPSGNIPVVIAA